MKIQNFTNDSFKLLMAMLVFEGLAILSAQATFVYPDMTVDEPTTDFPFDSAFTPSVTNKAPNPGTPEIAEWTRSNQPGDTMALTGEDLSSFSEEGEEGRDTRFVVYSEGLPVADGLIQRLDGRQCAVTLPDTLAENGMYLMWPHNAKGFGKPVAINQTEAWWVGFDTVNPGETFYAYGRNLSLGGGKCYLYIKELKRWLTSTAANPYKATFEVPDDVAVGTYTVYVHNGHGGKYGFSDALTLTVEAAYAWNDNVYDVTDPAYGADGSDANDDTAAIEAAHAAARSDRGSTLYFPAGTYYMTSALKLYANMRYAGAGIDSTTITTHSSATDRPSVAAPANFNGGSYNIKVQDMTLLYNEYSTLTSQGVHFSYGYDYLVENVRIKRDSIYEQSPQGPLSTYKGERMKFKNCEFYCQNGIYIGNLKDGLFEGCQFIGRGDCNQYTAVLGAQRLDFSDCLVKNADDSDASRGDNWGKGRWITMTSIMTDLYVGNSVVTNCGPRRPTPLFGPADVLSVGPKQEVESVANFGDYFAQDIYLDDIPDELHNMVAPKAQWDGLKVTNDRVVDGVAYSGQTYVKYIDATNNIITAWMPSYSSGYPMTYDSMTVYIKDIVDENSGEIILYEGAASSQCAYPASATATSLTFADANTVNAISTSQKVSIVDGRGLGQTRAIDSVDVDTKTVAVSPAWQVVPDETSVLNFGGFAYHTLIYDNEFDGRMEGVTNYSAVTTLNVYGNGSGIVVANNKMHELGAVTSFFAEGYGSSAQPGYSVRGAEMFNYVANNAIDSCNNGFNMNERENTSNPSNNDGVRHLGHVFRNNSNLNAFGGLVSMSSKSDITKASYRLNIFQDNVFSNFVSTINEPDGAIENSVWVGNTFHGNSGQTGYAIAENHVPVLRGNSWINFDSNYGENRPGAKLEIPIRHSELESGDSQVKIPVWNSGTDPMEWTVKKMTDASWLSVSQSSILDNVESDAGWIVVDLVQPFPSVDSEAILSVSDGVNAQQLTVSYDVETSQIKVSSTVHAITTSGYFWIKLIDQETQEVRDLGKWTGPCEIPIESMPVNSTLKIWKFNDISKAWEEDETAIKGGQPTL
jgi:hypothetical protein